MSSNVTCFLKCDFGLFSPYIHLRPLLCEYSYGIAIALYSEAILFAIMCSVLNCLLVLGKPVLECVFWYILFELFSILWLSV